MTHDIREPYAVLVNVKELQTSGRRAEVARLLLSGMRKNDIVDYLMQTFGMEYKQAISEYKQGYVYIYLNTEYTKEEIRKVSLARLEQLWDLAELDELLEAKEYYKIQMKNVDMTNKTAGLYDQETEKQNMTGDFTITIGAKQDNRLE